MAPSMITIRSVRASWKRAMRSGRSMELSAVGNQGDDLEVRGAALDRGDAAVVDGETHPRGEAMERARLEAFVDVSVSPRDVDVPVRGERRDDKDSLGSQDTR